MSTSLPGSVLTAGDPAFWGLYVSGDVGDLTIYTTRSGKVVAFPRSPPTSPPTQLQLYQRARFARAQKNWMAETAATRSAWETMTKRLSIAMTGQNAYISQSLSPDPSQIVTINRKLGMSLAQPSAIT